jgi:hypothetical protein
MSKYHADYIELELERLNSIVFTGGITKVLENAEIEGIVSFFYRKILKFHRSPSVVIDRDYRIWTYGMDDSAGERG